MVTIPVQVSEELAARLAPLQDRLPQIIELGLRQMAAGPGTEASSSRRVLKARVLATLRSTGIVTVPEPAARRRKRHAPIRVGGQPASEIII